MSDLEQWPTARLLITASRLVENAYNEELAGLGITYAGLTVLAVLAAQGALKQADLAEELKVQNPSVGKMIERLARKGFVTGTRCWPDRRTQLITISPAGQDVLSKARGLEDRLQLPEAAGKASLRDQARRLIATYW
ncbi:MarR family transcriptional regulator [Arthrobacter crystallopoietes]|uniref:MarR family winged helix-turn-helix transcriptional regulator n=1 Tax=Crystallibacter crystallopoietes TaxID=37928 RepID=UPI003D2076EF